ncbi:hypothetical protein ACFWB1_36285 [Streptomyces goshikiensis]|uniref:hypothetical protein n=1 Tax=Streptomyces TaxID=1883 RepID=UPI000F3A8750|nr:hypothetical protein [Streptomyces sp. ADI95-16]AYV31636.1 hypothetical protein EES41_33365 [Streptomyces sp. ADI95-16]
MGKVLTTASTVTCGHVPPPPPPPDPPPEPPPVPDLVKTSSTQKLKVEGKPVLVKSSLMGATIANCPNTVSPLTPCTTVQTVSLGESGKLRSGGFPVMLDRISLTTNGSVPLLPVLTPAANQSKLSSE